nr:MAG TPA: hypothetical protein [Caudoviricetes sp.]
MVSRLALTLRTVGVNKYRNRIAASMTLLDMLSHLNLFIWVKKIIIKSNFLGL